MQHRNEVLYKKDYDFMEDWEKFDDIIFVDTGPKLIIFPSQRTAIVWFWKEYKMDSYRHASCAVWAGLNHLRYNSKGPYKRSFKGCRFWRLDEFNYYLATGKYKDNNNADIVIDNNHISYQCEDLKTNSNYTIDTLGIVTSKFSNRQIKPSLIDGAMALTLRENGVNKMYRLARLVAEQFIPNPNNYPVVWYKDNDPYNCNANNLIWVSYKQLHALQNNNQVA